MKKQYITPKMEAVDMFNCLPIAASMLTVGGTVNEDEGDVKSEADWDIWADE